MLLWDTGCSDQLMHPDCAQWLIAKGARWRFCEPLAMQHGNKDATRPAPPATKQVCAEVFCTHQGHKYRQEEVWFYIYEGALQDAMLSDELLRTIPCITQPGRKLLDTSSHDDDERAVRDAPCAAITIPSSTTACQQLAVTSSRHLVSTLR